MVESSVKHQQTNKQYNFESRTLEHLDWIPQTSVKFQSQLNLSVIKFHAHFK
jgi:hypothetical protein